MNDNIERTLGRIEAKVDLSLADQDRHHRQVRSDFRELFQRVRSLERTRAWVAGAMAIVAAGLGWMGRNWFSGGGA